MSGAAVIEAASAGSTATATATAGPVDGWGAAAWLNEAAEALAGARVSLLDDERLLDAAVALERARRVLDGASAALLAEVESRGVTDRSQGMRTGSWLAHECRMPGGACRRRVTVARRLWAELPVVAVALREGRISWWHAEVLCQAANPRVAELVARRAPMLVELAGDLDFEPWRRRVFEMAARLDFDGGYDPSEDPEGSRVFIDPVSPDVTLLRGVFAGATGAELREVINRRAAQIRRRLQRDAETTANEISVPSAAALRAMALAELVLDGHGAASRSANAVTGLTVVLRQQDDGSFPAMFDTFDGVGLGWRSLAARLCDGAVEFLALDSHGVPLDLGHAHRFASDAQRKAALARDGGCVFPGCDSPNSWIDLHHVWRATDGGPTDLRNLACLCRYHHGVTHRDGWTMHTTDDHWFWWATPHGHTFWSQRHGRQRAGPTPARC